MVNNVDLPLHTTGSMEANAVTGLNILRPSYERHFAIPPRIVVLGPEHEVAEYKQLVSPLAHSSALQH